MAFTEIEQIVAFAATVIIISASGVMSPGPLFAANIFYGLKQGAKAGLKVSYGHTVVEFPLIVLLGFGALSLETFPHFRIIIAVLGALGLFGFAILQLKNVVKNQSNVAINAKHGSFLAGVMFSALNPFFLIWWFTIGFKLISDTLAIWSFWGIGILFGLHIWMDFAWLTSTAYLSSKSSKFISQKSYKFLFVAISGVMIYFGIVFLLEAIG